MAIIEFGPTVIGARGTVGGLTFSANKSGPYMKAWSRGGNPRTPRQQDNRNIIAKYAVNWGVLSQAERDDWDDYADDPAQELINSLGIDYFTSGFAWFVKINSALEQAGASQRDDAPTKVRLAASTIGALQLFKTAGSEVSRILLAVGSANLTEQHASFVRIFNSEGRQVASSGFTFMTNEVPNASRRLFIQDEMEEAFGTIQQDMVGFCELFPQDDQGQRGPVSTATGVVAA